MAIVKWDPFQGLERIFEGDFPLTSLRASYPSDLSVDVYEEGGDIVAEMHIADMDPESMDITVEDNLLRVVGRKNEEKEENKKNYYYKEIQRGSFERTIRLPGNVKAEDAKAGYDDGVLKIVIPKEEPESKKKKIDVEINK